MPLGKGGRVEWVVIVLSNLIRLLDELHDGSLWTQLNAVNTQPKYHRAMATLL